MCIQLFATLLNINLIHYLYCITAHFHSSSLSHSKGLLTPQAGPHFYPSLPFVLLFNDYLLYLKGGSLSYPHTPLTLPTPWFLISCLFFVLLCLLNMNSVFLSYPIPLSSSKIHLSQLNDHNPYGPFQVILIQLKLILQVVDSCMPYKVHLNNQLFILLKQLSKPKMEPLLSKVLSQQTETQITFMLHLTRNAIYPVSQSPKPSQLWASSSQRRLTVWSHLIRYFLICLFLILYYLSYKSFLPSAPFCSSRQETIHLLKR